MEMKKLLSLEELAQFALVIFLFNQTSYAWWWFLVLILTPDLSMLGYLAGPKSGAVVYNFFHHKALGVVLFVLGVYLGHEVLEVGGIILFAHAAMDRVFGYGLKHETGFKDTHMGRIG